MTFYYLIGWRLYDNCQVRFRPTLFQRRVNRGVIDDIANGAQLDDQDFCFWGYQTRIEFLQATLECKIRAYCSKLSAGGVGIY